MTRWLRDPIIPIGHRTVRTDVYCTDPSCPHASGDHPIDGIAWLGTRFEPPSVGPEECPLCGASTDTRPLFKSSDPVDQDTQAEDFTRRWWDWRRIEIETELRSER